MDISKSILPLTTLPRIHTDEPLVGILSKTRSSHDGVLLYKKQTDQFKGIAYPYNMLYRRRPSSVSTAGSVAFSPPKITSSESVYSVLKHMMMLRLYYLPVMDSNDKPVGIVAAKNILRFVLTDPQTAEGVTDNLRMTEPLLVDESAKISDVYSFMRKGKVSRVIVQTDNGVLEGILTRRDIYLALLSPAPNNRLKQQGGKKPSSFFDRDWVTQFDYPVKTYMSRPVLSALENESKYEILNKLLISDKNAIVITDSQVRPVGVITTRQVISTVLGLQPANLTPSAVTDKNNILSAFRRRELERMLGTFSKKIAQRMDVERTEIVIEPIRQNRQAIKLYDVKLTVTQNSGENFRSYSKQFRLRDAVHDCENKLLRQIDT